MKKRGFTLIELLAVIVILAVIALIATPIVIGLIENSREGAFKSSLYNVFNAAEYKLIQDKNTTFPVEGMDVPSLIMTNNHFTVGTVFQDEHGMYLENVADGKYCGNGYKDELKVTKGNCQTDAKWFTFDKKTGTITDYSNEGPKSVIIPRTIDGVEVKIIGQMAFYNKNITSVIIPDTVVTISYSGFHKNRLSKIKIPNSVTSIGERAFTNNQLPDNQAFIYNRNSDGTEDKTYLNSYGGANRENVILPDGIETIGSYAFYDSQLESVTLSNKVKKIETDAFFQNQLKEIIFPESVTDIGQWSFKKNQLVNIVFPTKRPSIRLSAFNDNQLPDDQAFIYTTIYGTGGVMKEALVSYGGARRENVIIPNGVTTIDNSAFWDTGLISVTLPNTLTKIDSQAFGMNKLTSIIIPASVTEMLNGAFEINPLTSVKIIGKSSPSDFVKYGAEVFGSFNESKIEWNTTA